MEAWIEKKIHLPFTESQEGEKTHRNNKMTQDNVFQRWGEKKTVRGFRRQGS